MLVGVMTDVMTLSVDPPYDVGIPLRLAADQEESGTNSVTAKHVEDARCVVRMRAVVEGETDIFPMRTASDEQTPRARCRKRPSQQLPVPGHELRTSTRACTGLRRSCADRYELVRQSIPEHASHFAQHLPTRGGQRRA